MSDKQLQRVTECVADIGHTPARRALPARRNDTTQKVRIAGQRTLYISVHDDEGPAEIFLRIKGSDCSSELIGLYDVIACLMSFSLQVTPSVEKSDDLLSYAKCGAAVSIYKSILGNFQSKTDE